MNTFIFLLICYGATNNLIWGSIFSGFRNSLQKFGTGPYSLHKLFTCFMCLGTWIGFAVSAIFLLAGIPLPLVVVNPWLAVFLHGLLSAGGTWLLNTIQEAFERHAVK
jgi:membrane-anchored protein YejM (alkaline phosphatase superfamily)